MPICYSLQVLSSLIISSYLGYSYPFFFEILRRSIVLNQANLLAVFNDFFEKNFKKNYRYCYESITVLHWVLFKTNFGPELKKTPERILLTLMWTH